ncbi:MAG: O-antigen ligase family protein [Rhodospirillales bacterium]|nr:O-antigen ligase family protein [Rhodospirillales bacterium]
MRPVLFAAALLVALAFAALAGPAPFAVLLFLLAATMLAVLAWRFPVPATLAWLVLTGTTLEMWLGDLLGLAWYQPLIAIEKGAGLLLALMAVARFGIRADWCNPGLAFGAIFAIGLAHGLYPGLTPGESLRSLVGSAAPYAFSFARLSRPWARAVIRTVALIPLIDLAGGIVLAAAGLRPLFVSSGGWRLEATSHPAFLGGFALAAIYACLIELYREGGRREMALLAANFAILVLSGARAPLLYAGAVTVLTLGFVPSPAFPRRTRFGLLLAALALAPLAAGLAGSLSSLRLFNLLDHNADALSGREALWAYFRRAAATSPWFGWGLGAGNAVIPQTSRVVALMHTWAAHNEYLRMAVEGGRLGEALLIGAFVLWASAHTAPLPRAERAILRLVFLAFACHAVTDNVLISTSASVLFALVSAVFARGALEAEDAARAAAGRHAPIRRPEVPSCPSAASSSRS